MAFPIAPAVGTQHTTNAGITYEYTADGAWKLVPTAASAGIEILSQMSLPPSGFVGDMTPRPNAFIDDGPDPDVLMTWDTGTNTYVPAAPVTLTQMQSLDSVAAGASYPSNGVPAYYWDDQATPPVLMGWNGSAYAVAGGGGSGPSDLGGTISPSAINVQNGVPVSETLSSSNGAAPFTFAIQAGALPAGLSLNSTTGAISGTPSAPAGTTYSFTIRATDANGDYNDELYSGSVAGTAIPSGTITPGTVSFTTSAPFSQSHTAAGGAAPYAWSITGGALPAGVSLNAGTGTISGTPTDPAGTAFNYILRATDNVGNFVDQSFSGSMGAAGAPISGGTITPNTTAIKSGAAYSQTFTAANGVAPYTWAIQSGALPAGLTLNAVTGEVSGTATDPDGTAFNFTLRATDANSDYVDQVFTGTIDPASIGPSNPASFGLVGTYASAIEKAEELTANGNTLFVATRYGFVESYDVSDPLNPVLLDSLDLGASSGEVFHMSYSAGRLFIRKWPSLITVDASDPANMVYLGDMGGFEPTSDAQVSLSDGDNFFHIDRGTQRLWIIRTTSGGSFSIRTNTVDVKFGGVQGMCLDGNMLYLVSTENGSELEIYDVSNTSSISLVYSGTAGGISSPDCVTKVGNNLIVADGYPDRVRVIDVSDPLNPTLLGSVSISSLRVSKMIPDGDIVWCFDRFDDVRAIDVSDPANPVQAGTYAHSDRRDFEIAAGAGFLVSYDTPYLLETLG